METVLVAGFLCVYDDNDINDNFYLPRRTIQEEINSGNGLNIPLNINHNENAVIGTVSSLSDLQHGLFTVARVQSKEFLTIIKKIAAKSKLITNTEEKTLPPDPEIECLNSIFPGLSLSNRVGGNERDPFFKHVSICGVGRRPGTIAIFGRNLNWILDRFSSITEAEKEKILSTDQSCVQFFAEEQFKVDLYDLLADSLDTSYIKLRFPKLQSDKQLSGISKSTYIKASENLTANNHTINVNSKVTKETEATDSVSQDDCAVHAPDLISTICSTTHTTHHDLVRMNGSATGNSASLPAPQFSECVFLPKDTFCSLLNATAGAQNKNVTPAAPIFKTDEYITPYPESLSRVDYGNRMNYHIPPPYWYPSMPGFNYKSYRGSQKRCAPTDSDDEMSFPGDPDYTTKKKKRYREDDDRELTKDKNDIKELVDAIGMLRHEISALKYIRSQSPQRQHCTAVDTMPTIEEKNVASPKPSVVNASLTPGQDRNQNLMQSDQSLLSLNKKLFVEALNKMDN